MGMEQGLAISGLNYYQDRLCILPICTNRYFFSATNSFNKTPSRVMPSRMTSGLE
jgi:hypothetical protein